MIEAGQRGESIVLACSALRRNYRETLRNNVADFRLIHLRGERALVAGRLAARKGHYMNPALLDSQFAALETPADAIELDIGPAPTDLAGAACVALGRRPAAETAIRTMASRA